MILPSNGSEEPQPAPPLAGLFGVPVVLGLATLAGFMAFERPEPEMDVYAEGFSTQRALGYLPFVAQEPRPVGSEHHDRVRRWLMAEVGDTGVTPGVQAFEQNGRRYSNVYTRLPGNGDGGTVLLACHYDSRPETPGAADDGVAVVALLQVLRKLTREGALRNDLIFLFSDGEEHGLVGARHFADNHAWIEEVDCVLNFDNIGNDGPAVMFQTGPGSGALIERYAAVAPHPVATSLAPAIYEQLPNDTDFTVFLERGLPGLNFAVVGGGSAYHQPIDTHQNIDRGTIQLVGDTALALARDLGEADLAAMTDEDVTYFDVLGRRVVHYPRSVALVLLGAALVLLGGAKLTAKFRHRLSIADMFAGVGLFGAYVLLAALLGYGLWWVIGLGVDAFYSPVTSAGSNLESSTWTLGGLTAWAAFCLTFLLERLRLRKNGDKLAPATGVMGLALWGLPLLFFALLDVNAGAELVVAALLSGAAYVLGFWRLRKLLLLLAASAATLLVAPVIVLAFHLLSTHPPTAVRIGAIVVPFTLGLAAPLLAAFRHGWVWRTVYLLGSVGLLVMGAIVAAQGS